VKRNYFMLIILLSFLSVLLLINVKANAQNIPVNSESTVPYDQEVGPPVLVAPGNKAADVGKPLQFPLSTVGPDSDLFNYFATGLPKGAVFDPVNRMFSWTPGADQTGTYRMSFHVTDWELTDTKGATIKVNKLSGKDWCSVYPCSASISSLNPAFGSSLKGFLNALGAPSYIILETWRSEERNWLMYYSWKIAREGLDPAAVPPNDKIYINWVHDDLNASVAAAAEMVKCFKLDVRPGIKSCHVTRNAVDMFIFWNATESNPKIIYDNNGNKYTFTKSKSASEPPDANLKKIAASYGVRYPGYIINGTEDVVHWE
jgi:Putative Ig domain